MTDPRPAGVVRRLSGAGRIVAFCSAKGGVGKSFCAVVSALAMASAGRRVGLLDLDLQGASTHLFLGARLGLPAEEDGILPVEVMPNLLTMSAVLFTGERALALRGPEISNAILE
jgi:ATP-binding protein involved in chromosome partitioning